MSQHDRYISPFSTRYSSDEMQYIFSDDNKFRTWRRLWVALARAEMKQGLTNITPEMVEELEAHVDDINYDVAIAREKLVRHDVMSHVYAYGQQCPKAAGIIHLGATSCYVGDNTDIIVMRQGLELIRKKLIGVLAKLARFAEEYKDMPCMAYTHCQPAQPTTDVTFGPGKQARIQQDVHIVQACLQRGGEVAKGKLFRPCCLVQGSQYSRDLNQQLKGRISVWVFLKQIRVFLHPGTELLRAPLQIIQIISRETVKTGWLERIKPIEEHPQTVSQLHLCVRHFSTPKQRD